MSASELPEPTVHDRMARRFFTAQNSQPSTDEQKALVRDINAAVVDLATLIEAEVPNGRNKSIALTALEDVSMRANRAIFDPERSRS